MSPSATAGPHHLAQKAEGLPSPRRAESLRRHRRQPLPDVELLDADEWHRAEPRKDPVLEEAAITGERLRLEVDSGRHEFVRPAGEGASSEPRVAPRPRIDVGTACVEIPAGVSFGRDGHAHSDPAAIDAVAGAPPA